MATTTFNIYKGTDGKLRLENYTATYHNQDWFQFLHETGQTDRLVSHSNNDNKPAHLRMVYVFQFKFDKI